MEMQIRDGILNEMLVQSVLKYRKIPLVEEVTRESIYKIIYFMNKIKDMDDKINLPKDQRVIEIQISSYGGCAYSCLGLISLIEKFKEDYGYTIITNVQSFAMSAGFFIAITGSKRLMHRYGVEMVHQVLSGTYGEIQKQQEDLEESVRLWDVLKEITIKYTNFTNEELENIKKMKIDKYLDAKTALEKNCIDEII